VDGGTGLARVFGYRFLGPGGDDLPAGGGSLASLVSIETGERPGRLLSVTAVADVHAPLIGPYGAARVFGPQKGATDAEVDLLEVGMTRLEERLRLDLGTDVADLPGGGASGGLGAGCVAFLDADLVAGSEWVLRRLNFDAALDSADLVVTGEGAWDATSGLGKITWEILTRARAAGVPAVLVCGRAVGPEMPSVTVVHGDGAWIGASDVTRLVAEAVG
jgi:glycerate kinase